LFYVEKIINEDNITNNQNIKFSSLQRESRCKYKYSDGIRVMKIILNWDTIDSKILILYVCTITWIKYEVNLKLLMLIITNIFTDLFEQVAVMSQHNS
jgi:hypothetical protein